MDFTLTDEQEMLVDTARALLAKECPPSLVRAVLDDADAANALWDDHLSGWTELGLGPLVDLCLFQTELGAALAPGPFFATAGLFLPLMSAIGRDDLLDAAGTVAMAGANGRWELNGDAVRTFVPEVEHVDHVAFVLPGPSVLVVDRDAVTHRVIDTIDLTRRTYEVDVPADTTGAVAIDAAALELVVQRATVALAAEMVGISRWLVTGSVDYSRERIQFGQPIGSFQGLQWKMVDMSLDHERAAAAVSYAAMTVDAEDADRFRAVHVAKAAAGFAARHAAKDGLQIHGGIGYTWEHDLHLYFRRTYASNLVLGDIGYHHDRLAELLLDEPVS
jgi:alkylation response protein AidB-like acyl-CoA dehydrogenase